MNTTEASPMLAVPSTGASGRDPLCYEDLIATGQWIGDTKVDGIRAFLRWDGAEPTFTNRHGVDVTRRFPELQAMKLGPEPLWLDGEIVALDGRFETVLTRDKQGKGASIQRLSVSHPCRFMAFDVPEYATWTFMDRRTALEELLDGRTGPRIALTVVSDAPNFLDLTREAGLEGVIAKRKNSTYHFGRRSKSWVKFKNLHRLTALVSGYTAGTGQRQRTFGALNLMLVDDQGQLVPIGTVGSGFSEREIHELKARLDSGEVLAVEIECLNRTSGNVLRFPVYKGIRTDVHILDCSTKQLDPIPSC